MKRALSATGRLSPLLRAGVIAGVVIAAALYPIAAIGGMGLKASRLPSALAKVGVRPPQVVTRRFLAASRSRWARSRAM